MKGCLAFQRREPYRGIRGIAINARGGYEPGQQATAPVARDASGRLVASSNRTSARTLEGPDTPSS